MGFQRLSDGIGGAQHLYVESLKQGTWAEFRSCELVGNVVIYTLGRFSGQPLFHPEYVMQFVGNPLPGRSGPEEIEVLCDNLPDLAMVTLNQTRPPKLLGHSQVLERDPLRIQHPVHVMIRDDQKVSWAPEGVVRVSEYLRIHVTMGAHQGGKRHSLIELSSYARLVLIRSEEAMGRQEGKIGYGFHHRLGSVASIALNNVEHGEDVLVGRSIVHVDATHPSLLKRTGGT